ncbi:MAG: hypothetical protein ACKOOD_02950 [Microbacteriaceae bacterium]
MGEILRRSLYALGIAIGSFLSLAMPSWAAEEEPNSAASTSHSLKEILFAEQQNDSEYFEIDSLGPEENLSEDLSASPESDQVAQPSVSPESPPLPSSASIKETLEAVSDQVVQAALANHLGVGINFDFESNVVTVTTDIESQNVLRAIFENSSTFSFLRFVGEDSFEVLQEESGGQ